MSQINFKDETLDASDGVTKLLLAAEYWKEKASALLAKITEMEQQEPVQPAPIEQDTSVRKAWARFSNELHRSPDAPYPEMSEAFEKHFSQSFTDREWRAESGVWAAAWKAAKNHGAQPAPSIPEGWKLVPIEPTQEMRDAWELAPVCEYADAVFRCAYREMLAAAPEAKP